MVSSGATITKQLLIKNLSDDVGTFALSEEHRRLLELQKSIIEKGQANGEILSKMKADFLLILLNQSMHSTVFIWCIKNGEIDLWNSLRYMFEKILDAAPQHCKMQNYSMNGIW